MQVARVTDAVVDDFRSASQPVASFVGQQPIELRERKAVEPLREGVAGWRDVLGQLGPRLCRWSRLAGSFMRRTLASVGGATVASLA